MGFGIGGFGSVAFGSTLAGGRTFTYTPTQVPQDGGVEVTFTSGLDDGTYVAHFGPNLDDTDPLCYSGVEGQGSEIVVENGGASLWIPTAPLGTAGFYFVKVTGAGASDFSTSDIIAVVPFPFRREMLDMRKLFPPQWRMGYREPGDIGLQV